MARKFNRSDLSKLRQKKEPTYRTYEEFCRLHLLPIIEQQKRLQDASRLEKVKNVLKNKLDPIRLDSKIKRLFRDLKNQNELKDKQKKLKELVLCDIKSLHRSKYEEALTKDNYKIKTKTDLYVTDNKKINTLKNNNDLRLKKENNCEIKFYKKRSGFKINYEIFFKIFEYYVFLFYMITNNNINSKLDELQIFKKSKSINRYIENTPNYNRNNSSKIPSDLICKQKLTIKCLRSQNCINCDNYQTSKSIQFKKNDYSNNLMAYMEATYKN